MPSTRDGETGANTHPHWGDGNREVSAGHDVAKCMASVPPSLHVVAAAGTGDEGAHCAGHQRVKRWVLHLPGPQEAGHVADASNAVGPNLVLVLAGHQTNLQQALQHLLGQDLPVGGVLTSFPGVSGGRNERSLTGFTHTCSYTQTHD